jgi:ABC-type transport system involved in multi-copper enzyme maturation permease subunit
MRFLAILRDSLRETLDFKIFYFLLGVSVLVILLIGSITYRPVSAQNEIERSVESLDTLLRYRPRRDGESLLPSATWQMTNFHQTDEAEPWQRTYSFDLVATFASGKEVALPPFMEEILRPPLAMMLPWLKDIEIHEAHSKDAKQVRFAVTTHGTTVTSRKGWPHEPALFFGALPIRVWHSPLNEIVQALMGILVGTVGAGAALLLSTLVTASFVPNMLHRGTVDLLLVKPIRRSTLLLYKYVGGLLFMFLNTILIVVGIWLVVGLQSGLWCNGFLLFVFVLTFEFAVYYACSTLFGVLTRSTVVAILMTCLLWVLLYAVGSGYVYLNTRLALGEPEDKAPHWVYVTVDTAHAVLPRIKDLDVLNQKMLLNELLAPDSPQREKLEESGLGSFHWGENLGVSAAFIGVMLGLACWRFGSRDY